MLSGPILNLLPVRVMAFSIDVKTHLNENLMNQNCAHPILALGNFYFYHGVNATTKKNGKISR